MVKPNPPKLKAGGAMQVTQRPHEQNQQIAKSVRPQMPRDGYSGGHNTHTSGQLPVGGYTSVWSFCGTNTKKSPTDRPGRSVMNGK